MTNAVWRAAVVLRYARPSGIDLIGTGIEIALCPTVGKVLLAGEFVVTIIGIAAAFVLPPADAAGARISIIHNYRLRVAGRLCFGGLHDREGLAIEKNIVSQSPVKIEYSLTKKWQSFSKHVDGIAVWAKEWM